MDIKGSSLIKGIHLEGLRKIGDPVEIAESYYLQGIDEILFMDVVASLYGRNQLNELVQKTAENIFVPITVGGGIRSVEDAKGLLRIGADKIALNTAAVENPQLLNQISQEFGSQATVLSIEAKSDTNGNWNVLTNNGRDKTDKKVAEWIEEAEALGVGEILLTSVDSEGTGQGFDLDLIKLVTKKSTVPIVISGGMGQLEHLDFLSSEKEVSGVAVADVLHYRKIGISQIKDKLSTLGNIVRIHE
jgi:cyclase